MKSLKRYTANTLIAGVGLAALVYLVQLSLSAGAPSQTREARAVQPAETRQTVLPAPPAGGTVPQTVRIGWTAWTDAEVVTKLARRVLEERFGLDVDLVMADIGIQYQGVANGDLDLMLMAWLPVTHADYWRRFAGDVVDLGILYTRARLGWAVPAYVPEERLGSIADLADPAIRRRLGGRVQGIDPGSGLMQASERAIDAYGLQDYELVSASGAAMTAALARAIERNEWIVVTAWNPHWMFARWDLRYLDDPKRALGGREHVDALARKGFYQDFPPEISEFLARMYLPLDELEEALLTATNDSVDVAVDDYLTEHADRIDYWVTGQVGRETGGGDGPAQ
jgi:glycine betaine/proline transport system substrate-binding protein